jgi:hypothetical protein
VQAGLALDQEKRKLRDAERRSFAPFLSGSNAESYLRLAVTASSRPADQNAVVGQSIALLQKTVAEGNEEAAKWAILRIADVELSRRHLREGLEWMNLFFNLVGGSSPSFFKLVDERAFAAGIVLEKPQTRCEAIELFRKADVPYSVLGRLLIEDAYRRSGDLKAAALRRIDIEDSSLNKTQWLGPIIPAKMALVRAKLDVMSGSMNGVADVFDYVRTLVPDYESVPLLLADAYELALVSNDKKNLTHLEGVLGSETQFLRETITANQGVSSVCSKSAN